MPLLRNPRYEVMAQHIAAGHSFLEAYLHAGGQGKRAAGFTKRIRDIIRVRTEEILRDRETLATQEIIDGANLTRDWIIRCLMENAARALQKQPVVDAQGRTILYKYEGAVANRALELLGKELGMFIDRSESGPAGAFATIDQMSAADLVAYVNGTKPLPMLERPTPNGHAQATTQANGHDQIDVPHHELDTMDDLPSPFQRGLPPNAKAYRNKQSPLIDQNNPSSDQDDTKDVTEG